MDLEEDLQNVCRVCRTVNTSKLVGIFDDRERQPWEGRKLEPLLADMLNECADCHIKPKDSLPQKICRPCIEAARQSFRFKRMCENSYQFFKHRLKIGSLKDLDRALSLLLDPVTDIKAEPQEEANDMSNTTGQKVEENGKKLDLVMANQQPIGDDDNLLTPVDEIIRPLDYFESKEFAGKEEKKKKIEPVEEITNPPDKIQCKKLAGEKDEKNNKVESRPRRLKATSLPQQEIKNSFQCYHCSKTFEQKSYLNKHLKRHSDNKSHVCPTCGKSFLFQTLLVTHLRVHTGERPFKCKDCSLTFTQNHHLKDHVKIHTGMKPFQCMHCPRTFTQRSNLKLHINLHTDKGPYKCPECSKLFSMKCGLTKHLPVHNGDRQFQCPYCSKTYTKSHSLNRHIRDHTGDLYRCTSCAHVFKELYKLRHHYKNVHGIGSNDINQKKFQPKVAIARMKCKNV